MAPLAGYPTLMASAFLAATIIPAQSEIVMAALVSEHEHSLWLLLVAGTLANTMGSVVNWCLGRLLARPATRFRVPRKGLDGANRIYKRWGAWSLLFAWTPFLGDPLTVVAGVVNLPLRFFIPLVAIGKGARYAALAYAIVGW